MTVQLIAIPGGHGIAMIAKAIVADRLIHTTVHALHGVPRLLKAVSRRARGLTIFLALTVCFGENCFGDFAMERKNSSGITVESYGPSGFTTALSELEADQTLYVYPWETITATEAQLNNVDGVTIIGGQQSSVTIDSGTFTYNYDFDESGFGNSQQVWFSGDVPTELRAGKLYYVVNLNKTEDEFEVSEDFGGESISVTDRPHGKPCYVQWTATIQCDQSSGDAEPYDYILLLKDCDDLVITNLRFDGRDLSNTKNGVGLKVDGCLGELRIDGVCASQTRGKSGSLGSIDYIHNVAYGIDVRECDDAEIYQCAGYNTGNYALVLTQNNGFVDVQDLAISHSITRDLGTSSEDDFTYDTTAKIHFTRCYLYNNDNPMTQYVSGAHAQDVPRQSIGLNDHSVDPHPEIVFNELYIDWQGLHDETTGDTWDIHYGQQTPLMKAQNVKLLKFDDSEFLHGDNKHDNSDKAAPTLKVDDKGEIVELRFVDCVMSCGILFKTQQDSGLTVFYFKGGNVQRDGQFDLPAPFTYVQYPSVELSNLTIDHVGGPGESERCVIFQFPRNYSDLEGEETSWSFTGLDVNLDTAVLSGTEMLFVRQGGAVTDTPVQSDSSVTWGSGNLVEKPSTGSFKFSNDDQNDIHNP